MKNEVAKQLRVCQRTVENLMSSGQISYIRIGDCVRFEPSEIVRFKKAHTFPSE
jgi:excisionase family DNA binding protein